MSIVKENSFLRVAALEINEDGKVSRKNMTVDRDSQLENTLLKADYPAIRVATIDIPQQQLDQYQQAMVDAAHHFVLIQPIYQVAVRKSVSGLQLTAAGWMAELGGAKPA